MKYTIYLENIKINNMNIDNVDITMFNDRKNINLNDKNTLSVYIEGKIYTKDNESVVQNIPIKDILKLKNKYFDTKINIESFCYKLPSMYIQKFEQNFEAENAKYKLILQQKFLGDREEIELNDNKDKQ